MYHFSLVFFFKLLPCHVILKSAPNSSHFILHVIFKNPEDITNLKAASTDHNCHLDQVMSNFTLDFA